MGKDSKISWTNHTFNIAWGCTKVSPGCKHCYAETLSNRRGGNCWGPHGERKTLSEAYWSDPYKWERDAIETGTRPRVFACSMCDVFEEHPVLEQQRKRLWFVIETTPHLDWLLLTKRSPNIEPMLPRRWHGATPGNIWLGTSIENNDYVWRADDLRTIPAPVRFISYEPALGPVPDLNLDGIDWLIYGGESGNNHRPDDDAWPRAIRDKCLNEGVAFYHKQRSGQFPGTRVILDGVHHEAYPVPRKSGVN